jgi:hypothetical protein
MIWRELELAAREKPVVISMGNYAASGGYYISAPGQRSMPTPLLYQFNRVFSDSYPMLAN